jgi:hypothetical protein
MVKEKYNLAGNCVHGLDDPYFRRRVCYDATEMAGIVDEYSNDFLLSDDFIKNVNWSYDLMGLPADNIYDFAYNPHKDIYWAYNIEDDVHFFFVKDSINENYRDTITVKTIKLSDILEGMLSEPEGKYLYIGTCVDSFDEYGECIHDAFYDEEHFFNSWQNAVDISKEEFWSNIDPLSDKYDEVKELEADPEYPAEYRYSEEDDIYFIFVGDYLHYFFVSPDSYENIKDSEDEDSYDINLQENIQRIKQMMGLKEDTIDYGYLHPAIVSELYNILFDNGVFIEPEAESTYGGRHFYIRMKDTKSAMEITINYAIEEQPTIAIHTPGLNGLTQKGLYFQDAIDLILSYKDEFMDFNEAVTNYQRNNQQ